LHPPLPAAKPDRFDTCTLKDAIDHLGLMLDSEGFTGPGLRHRAGRPAYPGGCYSGYAATARVRSSNPPITGHRYFHHTEWWAEIERLPKPRIVVIEDADESPGRGSCVGLVAAAAFAALHCSAAVTNGSCRDVSAMEARATEGQTFGLFGGSVSPARAYSHLVAHSTPVHLFGLRINPTDLIAVDCHGLIIIPADQLESVCAVAAEIRERKRTFVDYCTSPEFSIEGLENHLRQLNS
jgi:regulator of RNase E activity RraA